MGYQIKGASDAVVANCNYKLTEQKQQIYSNKSFYLDGVPTFVTTAKKDGKTYYVKTVYDSKGYSVSNDVYTLSGKNLKLYESLPATDEASFNKLYEKYDIVIDTCYNYGCTEYETIVFNGPESFGIDYRKGTIVKCVGLEYKVTAVAANACSQRNKITQLMLPSTMTVKSKAFYGIKKTCEIRATGSDADAYAKALQAGNLNKKKKIRTLEELIASAK